MKVYAIKDEIRAKKGKPEYTYYEYAFERDAQVFNRMHRYEKEGYKVKKQQNWWTTVEIILG